MSPRLSCGDLTCSRPGAARVTGELDTVEVEVVRRRGLQGRDRCEGPGRCYKDQTSSHLVLSQVQSRNARLHLYSKPSVSYLSHSMPPTEPLAALFKKNGPRPQSTH